MACSCESGRELSPPYRYSLSAQRVSDLSVKIVPSQYLKPGTSDFQIRPVGAETVHYRMLDLEHNMNYVH
jgi:hypothetical protein